VLLEFEAPYEPIMDKAMQIFEHCMEQGWVLDGVMSQSLDQVESLWRLREDISESIAPFIPYKNDISVLITHVPAFIKEIDALCRTIIQTLKFVGLVILVTGFTFKYFKT
jgi:FAD/FMN-containing dehydrogenase